MEASGLYETVSFASILPDPGDEPGEVIPDPSVEPSSTASASPTASPTQSTPTGSATPSASPDPVGGCLLELPSGGWVDQTSIVARIGEWAAPAVVAGYLDELVASTGDGNRVVVVQGPSAASQDVVLRVDRVVSEAVLQGMQSAGPFESVEYADVAVGAMDPVPVRCERDPASALTSVVVGYRKAASTQAMVAESLTQIGESVARGLAFVVTSNPEYYVVTARVDVVVASSVLRAMKASGLYEVVSFDSIVPVPEPGDPTPLPDPSVEPSSTASASPTASPTQSTPTGSATPTASALPFTGSPPVLPLAGLALLLIAAGVAFLWRRWDVAGSGHRHVLPG
jgi:hypothetical protein